MAWDVEYTDEFGDWWESLSADEQESVAVSVRLLEERGPSLGFPHSRGINGSRHGHMRELRTQHVGRPYRLAKGRPEAQLTDVPSERSERLEPIVRQPSRTQKLMPAPSMAGGAHGVSVLARKVICDVRIT